MHSQQNAAAQQREAFLSFRLLSLCSYKYNKVNLLDSQFILKKPSDLSVCWQWKLILWKNAVTRVDWEGTTDLHLKHKHDLVRIVSFLTKRPKTIYIQIIIKEITNMLQDRKQTEIFIFSS